MSYFHLLSVSSLLGLPQESLLSIDSYPAPIFKTQSVASLALLEDSCGKLLSAMLGISGPGWGGDLYPGDLFPRKVKVRALSPRALGFVHVKMNVNECSVVLSTAVR